MLGVGVGLGSDAGAEDHEGQGRPGWVRNDEKSPAPGVMPGAGLSCVRGGGALLDLGQRVVHGLHQCTDHPCNPPVPDQHQPDGDRGQGGGLVTRQAVHQDRVARAGRCDHLDVTIEIDNSRGEEIDAGDSD